MTVTGMGNSPERAADPIPGTIVYYNHPGDRTGLYPPKQSPAMVLNTHPDGTVDLRVFTQPTWRNEEVEVNGAGIGVFHDVLLSAGGQIENFRLREGEFGEAFTWCREYTPSPDPVMPPQHDLYDVNSPFRRPGPGEVRVTPTQEPRSIRGAAE